MLDKRLKWAFLVVALIFAGLPIAGIILDIFTPPNIEIEQTGSEAKPARGTATPVEPVKEDMVFIPAGEFLRGNNGGGLPYKQERQDILAAYWLHLEELNDCRFIGLETETVLMENIAPLLKHVIKIGP